MENLWHRHTESLEYVKSKDKGGSTLHGFCFCFFFRNISVLNGIQVLKIENILTNDMYNGNEVFQCALLIFYHFFP